MRFGKSQKLKFSTENGAYSDITFDENKKRQITATGEEVELLVSFFKQENIHVGGVKSGGSKARKIFKFYPTGQEIELGFVYPKANKTELRIYPTKRSGFFPEADDIWFLFIKNEEIWIGSMPELEWRKEHQILIYDESEGTYQDAIQELDEIKINRLKSRDVYARDRKKALERIHMSNYQCEFNPEHRLFISHATQQPYLEAHHLIPMSLQREIQTPLDTTDNIYCLCPHCHRAIHHAEKSLTKNIIDTLIQKRPEILGSTSTDISNIYNFYAVEEII